MYLYLLIFTSGMFLALGRHVQLEGNQGLYEGDIAVRTSFPLNANSSVKLGAIRDASKLWPGGKVPYRIDTDSIPNVKDQRVILEAMETLTNLVTCLEFQDNQVANKFDYVRIAGDGDQSHSSTGCWSYVGLQGGEQTLNLGSGCFTEELVLHELLHLLGIVHEQNRPDRDDFVEIMWSNIQPGMEGQFEKRNESEVTMQDTPYDFRSRMHYPEQSFSKSSAPTILARFPGNDNFGPVDKLSETDVVEISMLYQCDISSIVAVKYSHVNRYANEVRIELVWEELYAMNGTVEDKFCEIDDKLEEINAMLSTKDDKDNKCSELENKVNETVIKVESCDAQIQLMGTLFETNNNLVNKHLELVDLKTDCLEEKINNEKNEKYSGLETKINETVIKVESCDTQIQLVKELHNTKNELLNDKIMNLEEKMKEKDTHIERKLSEFVELFNTKNIEIEKLKEKTEKETLEMKNKISSLEEDNTKLNELNNQLEDKISKMGDCKWSSWSEYSQCSVTHCGPNGIKTRTRSFQQSARNGGAQCSGEASQTLACAIKCDCKWSSWSEYSQCSVTHCGTDGIKTKTRSIQQPAWNGGVQCSGEDSKTLACGECDPVLLHTDANYQYYKVPVPASSKMLSALVLSTCTNNGMQPQCFYKGYSDNNCVQAPTTSPSIIHPRAMSKILCSTTNTQECASTVNMFWYMKQPYYLGSACGATKAGFCVAGNDYTSTSDMQYFAACLKPV